MPPYTPPAFGGFAKSNLFQVYDRDAVEHSLKTRSTSSAGVAFENAVISAPGFKPRGYVKTSFGLRGAVVEAQIQTEASKASTLSVKRKNVLAKTLPGVNVGLSLTTSEKDLPGKPAYGAFATLSADYARPNFAATASVTSDESTQHAASASASVGFEGFSLGGDAKLVKAAGGNFEAKSYNAGVEYKYKKYTGALTSDAKFEKLKATAIASRVGPNGAWCVGAQAKLDLVAPKSGAPQRELIVGVQQVASPNTTYKLAAVVNTGALVATVEHRLRKPNLALSAVVCTAVPNSAYAAWNVSKFGVGLTLGDM